MRLFDNGTDQMLNKNLKELSENKHNKGKMTLSQEVIGGVVQGVLDQFPPPGIHFGVAPLHEFELLPSLVCDGLLPEICEHETLLKRRISNPPTCFGL